MLSHHSLSPVSRHRVKEDSPMTNMKRVKVPLLARGGHSRTEVNDGPAALLKESATPLIDGRHLRAKPEYLKSAPNGSGNGVAQLYHRCSPRCSICTFDNDLHHSARAKVRCGLVKGVRIPSRLVPTGSAAASHEGQVKGLLGGRRRRRGPSGSGQPGEPVPAGRGSHHPGPSRRCRTTPSSTPGGPPVLGRRAPAFWSGGTLLGEGP